MTADERFDYAVSALRSGASGFLTKPVDLKELRAKVDELLDAARQRRAAAQDVVLAVGAHPDDVEIGIGATLASHRAAGDTVVILTLSSGSAGGDVQARRHEALAPPRSSAPGCTCTTSRTPA